MSTKFFSTLRQDLPAGLVVFFIAVPLCLGIALASGAPLFSGLIAGIIGGIVIGTFSNSQLSVSGPAAGLTVVVLTAILTLGSFDAFLVAVVIAGVLQLLMGFLKAGIIANYFPSNVIKGMLTGIGIIIILKQFPHAFGYDKDAEGDFAFLQPDGENTFTALLKPFYHIDLGATIVGLVSMAIIVLWERPFFKKVAFLPGALVAIVVGTLLNEWWRNSGSGLALHPEHLVRLPVTNTAKEFAGLFSFPDFSHISNSKVWVTGITIAIVASLETLLCVEALDKLDPERRVTSPNRELKAQGLGNLVSGLLGGLPITSVIVRSSANMNAGARTKLAAIIHGVLILGSVAFLPTLLNRIPLAVLAALLIVTGYKLAKVSIFRDMFKRGWLQWLPFLVTVLAVVLTDLLTGVAIGMALSVLLILRTNLKSAYFFRRDEYENGDHVVITLGQDISFLHRAGIKITLDHLPENSTVSIDASSTIYVDPDVVEIIREFKAITAIRKNIHVTTIGLKDRYESASKSFTVLRRNALLRNMIHGQKYVINQTRSMYRLATRTAEPLVRVLTREAQQQLTPGISLRMLKEGNDRFVQNLKFHRNLLQQVNETKEEQYPFATILSCIDSRTSAELIFDQGLGDIFSVRIAGNIVNEDILGSMEFACNVAGSKIIVVLGHTKCGAVKGAVANVQLGNLSALLGKLRPAVEKTPRTNGAADMHYVDAVACQNVLLTVETIRKQSPILLEMEAEEKIRIAGAMYDVETGKVEFLDVPPVTAFHKSKQAVKSE